MNMFCYQCQETAKGVACTVTGVCGKKPRVAALLDLLVWTTKGLSEITTERRCQGLTVPRETDRLVFHNLFATITNVNFDEEHISRFIQKTLNIKAALSEQLGTSFSEAARWNAPEEEWEKQAQNVGVLATQNEDIRSLRELITYGLKGLAAYCEHAEVLGYYDDALAEFTQKTLSSLLDDNLSADELTALALETGKFGVIGMALLDKANTGTYGSPEISSVNLGTRNNPGILISGHDMKDMEMLLEQTAGTGVDVYTHGEMLPAHYYPHFKKFENLAGNYGNAWWKQREEFASFNGPILMTTNCIVPPTNSYKDRIFTTSTVGYPGCPHIDSDENGYKDFSPIIELAKKCPAPEELETGSIIGGFAHEQTLALAGKILEAVGSGKIKKFVVMAGCDGRAPARNYYTDFAKELPNDAVILTAGCAKYKYNKLNLGDIDGIPRVLDSGQCNDSYSLVVIALKLAEALGLDDVNDLPLVYNIAWYEQKAVIVLLALLHLGVKNIHLGPTLPAFLSPNVAGLLVEKFGIAGISTVKDDMELFGLL